MSDFAYPLHEECGVFGLYDRAGTEDVAAAAYSALYALQHRGQESCGIAVNDDGVIQGHRDLGLVNEVFTPAVLGSLANPNAHMATGHVRYATSGSRIRANVYFHHSPYSNCPRTSADKASSLACESSRDTPLTPK
jgi:amidophosphoribosyltransferase